MLLFDAFTAFGRELWSVIRADYATVLPDNSDLKLLYRVRLVCVPCLV